MSRAQALVEFAMVAPIFVLIILVIVEGGRFILYYQTLSNATREGARYAIVHGSNSSCPSGDMAPGVDPPLNCYDQPGANVVQRVRDAAFGLLGASVVVTPVWLDGHNGREADVQVTASYSYAPLVPLFPIPPLTVSAESTLVINN
jgi:Flp pilus assembly protein TadG